MEIESSRSQETLGTKGEGRCSRLDHALCRRRVRRDEVSEKLNEIIIDLKLW